MAYSGGFRADVFDENQVTYGPVQAAGSNAPNPIAIGRRLFTANCASCHQATGLGVPGQYPPLVASEFVLSQAGYGENHLVKIILGGLQGPVTVKGVTYNNVMPAWKDQLKDEQVAAILTYIRQEWGNAAGPISKEGVAAMRTESGSRPTPWTVDELRAIPAKALASAAAPVPAPAAAPAVPVPAPAAPAAGR